MKTIHIPLFKLSLLSIALFNSYAYANDNNAQSLPDIKVNTSMNARTDLVTLKQMDKSTATDLKELLSDEPAVSFGGGNGTAQWVTIRGMGQDQIDVKVDNVYSDTQIFHHNSRFIFDPELVKIVSVQKGTGSASAGIGATNGAIVAKTLDAADLLREGQNIGFKVTSGLSSNRGFSKGASVYGRWNGLDALFTSNWVTERDYKAGNGNRVSNSGVGQRGLLAKISYNFNDDQRIELSHRQEQTHGTRNLREEFDFPPTNGGTSNMPRYRILTQDTTNLAYSGKNLGVLGSAQANVFVQNTKRKEPNGKTNPTEKVITKGANIGFDTPLFEQHTLKYGVNWRHQESEPSTRVHFRTGKVANTVNEEKTDIGVYAEGIWHPSPLPLTLTTGLRYDHFEVKFSDNKKISGNNINPNIGVIYDVTPDFSLNAKLNYASRSPRLSEAMLSGNTVRSADPNLKAERARNAEIGFKYQWNDALSLEGNYFQQRTKNMQAFNSKTNTYYNGGTLNNKGYEFNATYQWQGLKAKTGLSFNKPKMNGASIDNIMTTVPLGRTWTSSLSYQFNQPNIEIGWRGRFVQSSSYDTRSTNADGSVSTTAVKRAGYGLNDIYANWQPTGDDHFNVNFTVKNVGNKYYKSHSQRNSSSSLPEQGRDFRVNVNYRF